MSITLTVDTILKAYGLPIELIDIIHNYVRIYNKRNYFDIQSRMNGLSLFNYDSMREYITIQSNIVYRNNRSLNERLSKTLFCPVLRYYSRYKMCKLQYRTFRNIPKIISETYKLAPKLTLSRVFAGKNINDKRDHKKYNIFYDCFHPI